MGIQHTSTTAPSALFPRSPDFAFFPRTAISRLAPGISRELSRRGSTATLWLLASSISVTPSGGTKVCSFRALRCRFALGCDSEASFEAGRCRLLLLRTEPDGACVVEGENIVLMTLSRGRPCYCQRNERAKSAFHHSWGVAMGRLGVVECCSACLFA